MALTECVQICWILGVCGFEKSLVEAGLAEVKRQLCLQSLHNLPYIGLLLRDLGCDSDGVRAKVLVVRELWI